MDLGFQFRLASVLEARARRWAAHGDAALKHGRLRPQDRSSPTGYHSNGTLVQLRTADASAPREAGMVTLPPFASETQVLASLRPHGTTARHACPSKSCVGAHWPLTNVTAPAAAAIRVLTLLNAADAFCSFDTRAKNVRFDELAAKARWWCEKSKARKPF